LRDARPGGPRHADGWANDPRTGGRRGRAGRARDRGRRGPDHGAIRRGRARAMTGGCDELSRPAASEYGPRMAFPRRLLIPGEDIVIELRPHWAALALAIVVGVLATAVAIWITALVHVTAVRWV